ncbi:terminase [Escherichia coli]|nr:terminase [Escherichia coli]
MNISNSQVNRLRHFVRAGLRSLFRSAPQSVVDRAQIKYLPRQDFARQQRRG